MTTAQTPFSKGETNRIRRPNAFARAAFALTQERATGNEAQSFVPKDDVAALLIIERATAIVGTTATVGFGAELARQSFGDFLADLQAYSGAARLIAQAVPARINDAAASNYPVRTSGRTVPPWVAESGAIPVTSAAFDNVEIGPARKMSHIVVWSRELAKRSDANAIFSTMLREDVAAGLDAAFFASTDATASAPAGLLYGLTSVAPTGAGEAAIKTDLGQLAETVSASGSGSVTFVVAPKRLARLRIETPELAASLDIVASGAVPADRVIAVDGPSLLVGIDPAPDLSVSENATLHMSDVPLPIVDGATADPVRSLWQTGSIALRVIHELDFVTRRAGAVAFSDGLAWW